MRTFHLPLPDAMYDDLRAEAAQALRPATEIVRQALEHWLAERRRERLAADIRAYAEATAGSEQDLDPVLEAAGLAALVAQDEAA